MHFCVRTFSLKPVMQVLGRVRANTTKVRYQIESSCRQSWKPFGFGSLEPHTMLSIVRDVTRKA